MIMHVPSQSLNLKIYKTMQKKLNFRPKKTMMKF